MRGSKPADHMNVFAPSCKSPKSNRSLTLNRLVLLLQSGFRIAAGNVPQNHNVMVTECSPVPSTVFQNRASPCLSANWHSEASANARIWHLGPDQYSRWIARNSRLVLENFSCPVFHNCRFNCHRPTTSRRACSYKGRALHQLCTSLAVALEGSRDDVSSSPFLLGPHSWTPLLDATKGV